MIQYDNTGGPGPFHTWYRYGMIRMSCLIFTGRDGCFFFFSFPPSLCYSTHFYMLLLLAWSDTKRTILALTPMSMPVCAYDGWGRNVNH